MSNKKPLKQFANLLIAIFLTLGLSISAQSLLAAWQVPGSDPPLGNANPPAYNSSGSPSDTILFDYGAGDNFLVNMNTSITGNLGFSGNLGSNNGSLNLLSGNISCGGVISGNGSGLTHLPWGSLTGIPADLSNGDNYIGLSVTHNAGGNLNMNNHSIYNAPGDLLLNDWVDVRYGLENNGTYDSGRVYIHDGAHISGNLENDGRIYADNGVHVRGDWLRVDSTKGLYFQSYGGGWHMKDSTWIRSYNGKRVYISSLLRADGGLYVGDDEYFYRGGEDLIRTTDNLQANKVQAGSFIYVSDQSLKENIKPVENALDKILDLEGVSFDWKDNGESSLGLIAQDVKKVFPEIVYTDIEGLKSVEYGNLVAPLIEAIKEQQKQIEELKLEIENLK